MRVTRDESQDVKQDKVVQENMSDISVSASSGLTEDQLDRLAGLERLDALDRRDRRDACAAAEAAAVRLGRLDRLDSFDAEAQGRALLKRLVDECGQEHLVSGWPRDRAASADERRLQSQLLALHRSLAGGLDGYVCRARELLEASRLGRNPLDGYRPSLPVGETLDFGRGAFLKYEEEGLAAMRGAAFVLVAGGPRRPSRRPSGCCTSPFLPMPVVCAMS